MPLTDPSSTVFICWSSSIRLICPNSNNLLHRKMSVIVSFLSSLHATIGNQTFPATAKSVWNSLPESGHRCHYSFARVDLRLNILLSLTATLTNSVSLHWLLCNFAVFDCYMSWQSADLCDIKLNSFIAFCWWCHSTIYLARCCLSADNGSCLCNVHCSCQMVVWFVSVEKGLKHLRLCFNLTSSTLRRPDLPSCCLTLSRPLTLTHAPTSTNTLCCLAVQPCIPVYQAVLSARSNNSI